MPARFRFSASVGRLPIDSLVDTALRAEELGYSAVTIPDHLDDQAAPLIGLTAVATATSTIRVLPLVLANDYRHPVVLAKELATLDVLSNGRLEFGIGAGWMTTDYEFSGIQHDGPGARISRLRESVDIITRLLAGDQVDIDGEHYRVHGAHAEPHPVQLGGIPLMLAGGKPKMLSLAAEKADIVGINASLTAGVIDERAGADCTPERTDRKLEWVRDAAGSRFDGIELQTRVHLAMITDDREKTASELAPLLGIDPQDALESPHALVGTVDQCVESVQRWRDRWGISYVAIDADQMDAFAPVIEKLTGS
ncbi:MAG: TIGR03621 family F420-dependent LLM class oxidoreductase [Acidimicrobiales bacterium]